MAFNTFDLGRVLKQGEAIKGMKRQGITDQLSQQYLQTQNTNAVNAGNRANEEFNRKLAGESDAKALDDAKRAYAESTQLASVPDEALGQHLQGMPHILEAIQKAGIDPSNTQAVRQILETVRTKTAAYLGQSPAAKPVQMETINNPDGSVFQKDPTTGKLTEVQGRKPRDPVPEKGPNAPAGYRYKADGSLEPIPGGPAAAGPKNANISEGERKAAALGTRLEGSLRELASIPLNEQKPGVMETVAGVAGETAANLARSSDRQRADAAQLDALDAALTLATGAAYTKEQLQNLRKSYFPQLGDSEANRKAKEKRFEMIVKTARIASGRAEPAINEAQSGATGGWSIEEVK